MSRYAAVHKDTKGAGDARPTALQIVQDEGLVGKLQGKVFLITGCSSGIGVETARALHATGADVFMTARDADKGAEVARGIQASSKGQGKLKLLHLELDSLQSVKECAASFLDQSSTLNVLVNNAGVMASPAGTTIDGFETQFGTNHLSHFLLFQLLKKTLLDSSTPEFSSRVVCLSSLAHRMSGVHFDDLDLKDQGYDKWKAYGQSKTANIYLATEIERRYGAQGLHSTALHPGGILSPLQRHVPELLEKYKDDSTVNNYRKSPEQGAATTVYAAISKDWENRGGKYLENCAEGELVQGTHSHSPGYAPHAYDADAAQRCWDVSLKMVGLA